MVEWGCDKNLLYSFQIVYYYLFRLLNQKKIIGNVNSHGIRVHSLQFKLITFTYKEPVLLT